MRAWPLALIAIALGVLPARAQANAADYPSRTVTIVAPAAPGGLYSLFARLIGAKLEQRFGKPVMVENRPGASSVVGALSVARATADGYLLMTATSSTMATNVSLFKNLPYDPRVDLAPVALIARVPEVLVVNATLPVRSVAELAELARATPGGLHFGSAGPGTAQHLGGEMLKRALGIELTHVPYKGAGPALNDLLGGHIDAMFDAMPVMVVQAKAGKVKPLAVTGAKRSTALPDVPTMMEAGVPDYEIAGWFGILAPANTPPAIAKRLRDEVAKAVSQPDVVAQLDGQGMQPLATEPEEWRAYMKAELDRYTKIIKDAGIKPE
jgi:tripartite-type tricarboxylate transporter receptor subunit TctC